MKCRFCVPRLAGSLVRHTSRKHPAWDASHEVAPAGHRTCAAMSIRPGSAAVEITGEVSVGVLRLGGPTHEGRGTPGMPTRSPNTGTATFATVCPQCQPGKAHPGRVPRQDLRLMQTSTRPLRCPSLAARHAGYRTRSRLGDGSFQRHGARRSSLGSNLKASCNHQGQEVPNHNC